MDDLRQKRRRKPLNKSVGSEIDEEFVQFLPSKVKLLHENLDD